MWESQVCVFRWKPQGALSSCQPALLTPCRQAAQASAQSLSRGRWVENEEGDKEFLVLSLRCPWMVRKTGGLDLA